METHLASSRQPTAPNRRKETHGGNLIRVSAQKLAVALPCLAALFACGCGRVATPERYMQPELLYLNAHPYARLYVEVDAVEGAEPPQEWIDELQAFLARFCDKPDGIAIARDEPVPLSEVKGLTPELAALLCTDGPPSDDGRQPAYLHVFFYNQCLFDEEGRRGLSGSHRNPHVYPYWPTTVFFNLQYCHAFPANMRIDMLLHETGHALGLTHSKGHGDGTHCRNRGCLMRAYEEIESELLRLMAAPFGIRPRCELCKDCLRDLESLKRTDTDPNLSFAGPFLVRREDGYCVASLPTCEFCEILGPSGSLTFEHGKALDRMKQGARKSIAANGANPEAATGKRARSQHPKSRRGVLSACAFFLGWDESSPPTPEQMQEALAKASRDPCPATRIFARDTLEKVKKKAASPAEATPTTPQS